MASREVLGELRHALRCRGSVAANPSAVTGDGFTPLVAHDSCDDLPVSRATEETRDTYDRVARDYAAQFSEDLADKVLDRALLSAIVELAGKAAESPRPRLGDLGCGPGFEARYLAELGAEVIGIDLSPAMIGEAERRHAGTTGLSFAVGSLLSLPLSDRALDGGCAIYSIIHLPPEDRPRAYGELARVIRPGGPLLLSVHVSAEGFAPGSCRQLEEWWGHRVRLAGYFLDPDEVLGGLVSAGFTLLGRLERGPATAAEFPSKRAYLVMRR